MKFMNKCTNYILKTINTLYYYFRYGGTGVVMNVWIQYRFNHLLKRNFGDELNYYIFKELSDSPMSNLLDLNKIGFSRKDNLLFVGSLVDVLTNENSIICGSGAICGDRLLPARPKKVLAVRGKLTRKYLLDQGVSCPEIYGDPALLLPFLYKPYENKKFKLGIIPHISDLSHPSLKTMVEDLNAHIIRFDSYKDWKSVIDEICSCEYILSSSLHGLIISDAYHIPNLWIGIGNGLIGGEFKFHDYFSSVGRHQEHAVCIDNICEIEDVIKNEHLNKKILFDAKPLFEVLPFRIKPDVHIS